ncbi:hypothetical protein LTR36_006991 [Oleoguttula mirabilis]|uniref:NTF2-like domain-containing protein n=1 Tax=Oleoguttula mirabilis TaxID=1507867 RepID=A0AAV9JBJ8_9PEZI|nr:hypothetical protein LTR36_006991 [Oleoguttula mirabilis]
MKNAGLVAMAALAIPGVNACLSEYQANALATNFGKLVSAYSQKLANQTLAPGFIDYSESVNSLMDGGGSAPVALLGETFSSRAAFESASASQPSVPFAVENVWFNCDTITVRWKSAQSPQPVIGISVFHTVYKWANKPVPFLIDEIWGEFDSASWLENLGILVPASKKQKREIAFEA